ncbi:anthranilate phosphoribosyltransferase [Thermincola potens]|uniref:Anthranilate phosphoribosyltransferase n=1 Tax=Thermincola potens (strain JR) TaxID=635013 RepID=D5X787_THEPJ|nr:anthranilate phosphoribosyltransferase [Thermincola potens JR]
MLKESTVLKESISKVVAGQDLNEEEAAGLMEEIMSGRATDAQIASVITALRIKGETVDEITGFARVMRAKATPVPTSRILLLDTCGTGGDEANTFNISTTVAFVVAGADVPVAKHGNRSVSSKSGSADVLEALGVNLNLRPEQVGACIDRIGIGFLFAPALHGAMKYAIGPRREIGIRTVFNILGPLTNPAGAQVQVLGVYDERLTEVLAGVLDKLGTKAAFVVHGAGGMDEVSLSGPAVVSEVKNGRVHTYQLDPLDYGFQRVPNNALTGGDPAKNARITRNVLEGAPGVHRDVVLINSALGLVAAGFSSNIADGIKLAAKSIDSGAALKKLKDLIKITNEMAMENQRVSQGA